MPSYRLRITSCGPKKIQVIKALRDASQATLLEAKRATDDPENAVCCTITAERLERLREEIVALGGQIEAEPGPAAASSEKTKKKPPPPSGGPAPIPY
jgi:ribosomal protein L7/L12